MIAISIRMVEPIDAAKDWHVLVMMMTVLILTRDEGFDYGDMNAFGQYFLHCVLLHALCILYCVSYILYIATMSLCFMH